MSKVIQIALTLKSYFSVFVLRKLFKRGKMMFKPGDVHHSILYNFKRKKDIEEPKNTAC